VPSQRSDPCLSDIFALYKSNNSSSSSSSSSSGGGDGGDDDDDDDKSLVSALQSVAVALLTLWPRRHYDIV